ncbi:hypothetical protein [Brevibacterium litoralis]|uniref:hypothetical protein n=1 Tax=Brevibacterium litoralis TaxID=3138935 RepID=UPI0032EC4A7D
MGLVVVVLVVFLVILPGQEPEPDCGDGCGPPSAQPAPTPTEVVDTVTVDTAVGPVEFLVTSVVFTDTDGGDEYTESYISRAMSDPYQGLVHLYTVCESREEQEELLWEIAELVTLE